jgi:hypothetical protein
MASIIANNIISSSSNISYQYNETEELFGYVISATYNLNVADIAFENGDGFLIAGREAVKAAYAKPEIIARIGGDEFLKGQIQNVSFPEGSLVGSETVNITIQESKRLEDYSSTNFCKYIPNPHLVSSFSETYNFTRSEDTYSYSRDINLTYKQDAGDRFLSDARVFLTQYYFANRPSFGFQSDGISEDATFNKDYRGLLTEKYDLIGLTVGLTENFNSSFIDDTNHISRKETQTTTVDEKGYLKKTFTYELTSLRFDSQNILQEAIKTIIAEVMTAQGATLGDPSSISKGIKKDGNSASLSVSFSTNPTERQGDLVTYSVEERKNEKFKDYILSANYKAKAKTDREKFNKAKTLWISDKDNNITKVQSVFAGLPTIFEKDRNSNFQKTEGTITETITFTDDPAYKNQADGLLKLKITSSNTKKIKRNELVYDLGDLKDKLVVSDLESVGQASVTATATIDPNRDLFGGKYKLLSKTSDMQQFVTGSKVFITSDVINLDLGEGNSTRTINYLYI